METMSLATVAGKFSDESGAWQYVEELRWHGHPVCPRCASDDVLYLAPRGEMRSTRTGKVSHRRVWKCRSCKRQFSCLVGTIFEGTKIPLRKWLMAVYLFCSAKNGTSALELQRDLGITYKSAWFMVHRIREAMRNGNGDKLFGIIVADETWVGGKPKNRHANKRVGSKQGLTDKTPVLSVVDKATGEIRSTVIPNTKYATIRRVLDKNVDLPRTTLHTDEAHHYNRVGAASHEAVNHSIGEYVRDGVSTNQAEGFFSQFKRSLDGTHHNVSPEHLGRYAREFDFRATTRKFSDGERATAVFDRATGAYVSYRTLIASGPVAQGTRRRPPGRPGPRQAGPSSLGRALGDAG